MAPKTSGTLPGKRRKYDEAFKAAALRLALESRSTQATAIFPDSKKPGLQSATTSPGTVPNAATQRSVTAPQITSKPIFNQRSTPTQQAPTGRSGLAANSFTHQ